MAGKGRNAVRIETEIEKSREDSNWKKVIELADQLKSQNAAQAPLCNFLLGEGKLEMFLAEWPPLDSNFSRARTGLAEAKRCLLNAASEQGKKAGVALDSHLLLGKLHYAMGFFEEALNHYNEADLQSLTEKALPSRSLLIVAESYAIKGLCLEKVPPSSTSKYKQVEWEEQMGRCYELAGDLTLLYLQEQDKLSQQVVAAGLVNTNAGGSHSPQPSDATQTMGPILETAIQRAPLIYIQTGKISLAVTRYRHMLCAVESSGTHGLRLTLTRQLAEVLLRGYTGVKYTAPGTSLYTHTPLDSSISSALYNLTCLTLDVIDSKKSNATSAWKPRLYTGINLFIPRNEHEEIILLLLISEAMAVREAVLSQSPEFKDARIRALGNATVIYDLLTIALVRWGQVSLLYECLERAMKFSYEEAHIWLQQALCLDSMGHHVHALAVLGEVCRLLPTKVMPCLFAARICYQHLSQAYYGLFHCHLSYGLVVWGSSPHANGALLMQKKALRMIAQISEGLQWSQKALARQTSHPQNLLSRCHLYIGIGAHYGAVISHLKQEKQRLQTLAHDSFIKAEQADPHDHLVHYYLGLECASRAQVTEAVTHTRAALSLYAEHAPSLQLMVLLLTAQKQMADAHVLLDSALQDFPDNLNLLYIKTHLQLQTHGPEVALATAKQMLTLWKALYEEQVHHQQTEHSDSRSHFQLYTSEMSDKDTSSLHAHSLAASRVEQALSEVASSVSSFIPRPGPQRAWLLQLQVWLLVAETYLALDQVSAAANCIQEATSIFPLSHHIMYTRGLVHEHKHEFTEAKQCYQNAVAINPSHIKSLQHLGLMYHYLGSHRLAEKTLRNAAKIDPHAPATWYNLGKVLEALGDSQRASDCMATALQVDTVSPVLSYSSIPITFE